MAIGPCESGYSGNVKFENDRQLGNLNLILLYMHDSFIHPCRPSLLGSCALVFF
jgi:hypothetical protein